MSSNLLNNHNIYWLIVLKTLIINQLQVFTANYESKIFQR